METRNLKLLMWIVITMVILDALYKPVILGGASLFPVFFATVVVDVADGLDGIAALFKIATMILFSVWIYRAGRNLVDFGYQDLEFTPGARIWWFAVPFANFVMPFNGMRELWNASHGRTDYGQNEPIVAIWWGLWLVHGFAGLIAGIFVGGDERTALLVQSVADLALALVAIQLLREITAAQARLRGPGLAEVFA